MDWTACRQLVPLRYGHHLFADSDGRWLLLTPDQQYIRLKLAPEHVEKLLPVFEGRQTPHDLLEACADRTLAAIIERFGQQGFLEAVNETTSAAKTEHRVVIQGDNPLAEAIADLLNRAAIHHQHIRNLDTPPESPTLLVSCEGWLPDTRWQHLDRWCRKNQVIWHMAYAEQTRFYLGPLFVPGETAGYADVRARRRAAAPFHDELLACWRHLESDRAGPVRWPHAGAIAVMAGVLVSDTLAVLGGYPAPSAGYQLGFDPQTMLWQRHPILPLPTQLMTEADMPADHSV
jgi:hypothetical protein